jgi:hypothetical protein
MAKKRNTVTVAGVFGTRNLLLALATDTRKS